MKTAIITGASQGIGESVARGLAKDGFQVALLARNKGKLEAIAADIAKGGGKAIVLQCDVSNETEVAKAVSSLRKECPSLDLLFNNAGAYLPGTEELSADDLRRLYDVNVFGVANILRHTVPWFRDQGNGCIIHLASIAGTTGFPGVGGYCSSKFAVRGLNESLHRELEPLGIRVTAISPSWVNTEMASHGPMDGSEMIQPDDILETIRYLLRLGKNATVRELVVQCRADLQ